MSESDGIEEAFEGTARVALTAAGQLAEQLARLREEQLGRARARSDEEGRAYAGRLHAERDAARAQLAPVRDDHWWTTASPQDVVQAYTTARSWEHVDPQAAQAAARIRIEARDRYGVELDSTPLDTAAMDAVLARGQTLERQALAERQLEREDIVQAQALLAQADRAERAADEPGKLHTFTVKDGFGGQERWGVYWDPSTGRIEAEWVDATAYAADHGEVFDSVEQLVDRTGGQVPAEVRERIAADMGREARGAAAAAYDSAERRAAFAADLESKGVDRELVATRLRADISNAKPATEVAHAPGRGREPGTSNTARAKTRQRGRAPR